MTTYNRTPDQGNYTPGSVGSLQYGRTSQLAETVIDFSVTGNTNVSGSVFECLHVPAGYAILATGMEVLAADTAGNSGTITIELASSSQGSAETVAATGFIASAGSFTPVAPTGSAAYLNLVIGTGAINAVVRLWALLQDCRAKTGTAICTGAGPGFYLSPSGTGNTAYSPTLTYVT